MTGRNIAASVRAKLLNKARADKRDFSLVLTRYALERLLYRLSISEHADHFLLKGALLFDMWFDVPFRPTRDMDLLGFGLAEEPHLIATFADLCALEVEDGIRFDAQSIRAEEIRKEANYAGIRVTLLGWVDGARCPVQVDVGYGDAVTPGPEAVEYPVMLDEFPGPKLRVYPRYSVVAEKLEAMINHPRRGQQPDEGLLRSVGLSQAQRFRGRGAATSYRRYAFAPRHRCSDECALRPDRGLCYRSAEAGAVARFPEKEPARISYAGADRRGSARVSDAAVERAGVQAGIWRLVESRGLARLCVKSHTVTTEHMQRWTFMAGLDRWTACPDELPRYQAHPL